MKSTAYNFSDRLLLGAARMLKFDSALSQYINLNPGNRYVFGASDFFMTILVADVSAGPILHAAGTDGSMLQLYYLDEFSVRLQVTAASGNTFSIYSGNLASLHSGVKRFSIIRRGGSLELWVNTRIGGVAAIGSAEQFNLTSAMLARNSSGQYLKGSLGNFVVAKTSMSVRELEALNSNNGMPNVIRPHIVSHYPLNEVVGSKAYDVSPMYNYSKGGSDPYLAAAHCDLVGFSNDDLGISNETMRKSWVSTYSGKPEGYLFNGVSRDASGRGQIAALAGHIVPFDFIIGFSFETPAQSGDNEHLFYFIGTSITRMFQCLYDGSNLVFSRFQAAGNTVNLTVSCPVKPSSAYHVVVAMRNVGGKLYLRMYVQDRNGNVTVVNNNLNSQSLSAFAVQRWDFFNANQIVGTYSGAKLGRFMLIENPYGKYPLDFTVEDESNYLVASLLNADVTPQYKGLPCVTDLNFGDVTRVDSAYKVLDASGNGYHVDLYNYNPATDRPSNTEQRTLLPVRNGALRMDSQSQHYLRVSDFKPTKEKGYTYIIGMKSKAATDWQPFFSNVASTLSHGVRFLWGNSGVVYDEFLNGGGSLSVDAGIHPAMARAGLNYCFVQVWESGGRVGIRLGMNGYINREGLAPEGATLNDHSLNPEAFKIGIDNNGASLNGYLNFAGVWKGVLSPRDIAAIANLGGSIDMPTSKLIKDCQLLLLMDKIVAQDGGYRIPDYSPHNREVIMVNYTADHVNPASGSYVLADRTVLV